MCIVGSPKDPRTPPSVPIHRVGGNCRSRVIEVRGTSTFAAQTGRTLVGRKQGRRKVSRHFRDHPDSEHHGQLRIGQGLLVFVGQLPNGWGEVVGQLVQAGCSWRQLVSQYERERAGVARSLLQALGGDGGLLSVICRLSRRIPGLLHEGGCSHRVRPSGCSSYRGGPEAESGGWRGSRSGYCGIRQWIGSRSSNRTTGLRSDRWTEKAAPQDSRLRHSRTS